MPRATVPRVPEHLLRSTPDAPWLPPGGHADVVRSSVAPAPAGLVRLLVRRDDAVWCTAREDGRVDLPTRAVPAGDPDGGLTAGRLALDVLGPGAVPTPLGFVRNVVAAPDATYPWPTPLAHFTVWTAQGTPSGPGTWVGLGSTTLTDRHWWPLVESWSAP